MGDDLYLRIKLQCEDMMSSVVTGANASLIAMAESAAESGVSFDGLAVSVDAATVSMEGIDTSLIGITASTDEAVAGIGGVDASLVSMGESADVVVAGMGGVDTALASVATSADTAVVGIGGVTAAADTYVVGMGGVAATSAEASASLGKTAVSADAAKASLGGMNLALVGLGVGVAVAGAASVKMAGDFQQSMIKSQAEAGLTKQQMTDMGNAILQMAPQVGQAPKQLADGLFFVESAGFAGKDALDALRLSAQMASNDMSDTSTVAKGLTAATKAFGLQTSDSAMVANQMTVTVSSGKMTMSDYANVIGKTAQMAHNFHVGMSDTNAALDVLSNNGFPSAATAGTALQNVLQQFDGNTAKIAKNVRALGGTFDENKFKSMDLAHQVQYLSTAMKGHEDQLQHVLGGSKSAALGFNALKTGAAEYGKDLQKLNDAQKNGGAEAQSFAATQQGFNFQMQQASAAVQVLMIDIGNALLPVLSQLLAATVPLISGFASWLEKSHALENGVNGIKTAASAVSGVIGPIVKDVGDWAQKNDILGKAQNAVKIAINDAKTAIDNGKTAIKNIQQAIQDVVNWYNQWKPIINTVAGVIIAFFTPAMIKAGAEAVVSGVKITTNFVASIIKSGAEAVVNGVKVTVQFVQAMVKAGVEAVINGAKITGQFVASIIKTGIEGWQSAGKLLVFIGNLIATGAQAALAGIKVGINFVGSLIAAGAQAALAGVKIAVNFVGAMLVAGTQAVLSGVKIAASFVGGLISAGAEAIVSAGIFLSTLVPSLLATAAAALAATWPFLLIGAVVAAVVVGVILAIQHWGQIVAWLQGVWAAFSSWFQGALKGIETFFTNIWHGIQSFFQSAWNAIVNAAKIAAMVLFVVITGPIGLIALYVITHWTQVHQWLVNAWNSLKGMATTAWNAVHNAITSVVTTIVNWIKTLWTNEINGLGAIWNGIKGLATTAWNNAYAVFQTIITTIVNWAKDLWNREITGLGNIWNGLKTFATKAWNGVVDVFKGVWGMVSGPLNDLWNNIKGLWNTFVTDAENFGKNVIQGIINGINSMITNIGNAVSGVADKIKSFLGFHSPTKEGPGSESDTWAPNLVKMYTKGILDGVPQIQSAVNTLSKPIAMSLNATNNAGVTNAIGNINLKSGLVPSTSSTPLQGGSTTTNNSGGTTIINNYYTINVPQGRLDRASAQQMAKIISDEMSSMQRRSGNLFTNTSGGRS